MKSFCCCRPQSNGWRVLSIQQPTNDKRPYRSKFTISRPPPNWHEGGELFRLSRKSSVFRVMEWVLCLTVPKTIHVKTRGGDHETEKSRPCWSGPPPPRELFTPTRASGETLSVIQGWYYSHVIFCGRVQWSCWDIR